MRSDDQRKSQVKWFERPVLGNPILRANFEIERLRALEKSDSVANPNASPDLGRKILNERDVVHIEFVGEIKGIDSNSVGEMLTQSDVRAGDVKNTVSGCPGFVCEETILIANKDQFRSNAETSIVYIKSQAPAKRRNAGKVPARTEFGPDVINTT